MLLSDPPSIGSLADGYAARAPPLGVFFATPPKEILGELFTVLYIFVGSGIISGFISIVAKNTIAR